MYINHILLIHLSVSRHWVLFTFGLLYGAAVNTSTPVFVWMYLFISLEYITGSGIAGSDGNYLFRSLLFIFSERLWAPGSRSFLILYVLLRTFLLLANVCCVGCLLCTWFLPRHCGQIDCHRVLAYNMRGERVQLSIQKKNRISRPSGLCINIHPHAVQLSSLKILFIAFCNYRNCRKLGSTRNIKKETKNYL